jgi:hypothetical protein
MFFGTVKQFIWTNSLFMGTLKQKSPLSGTCFALSVVRHDLPGGKIRGRTTIRKISLERLGTLLRTI